jgi:CBS domain-containing protein
MNRRPVTVDAEMSMGDVARVFLKKKIPSLAVVEGEGRFLGLISTQGLMRALMDVLHDEVPAGPVKHYLDPDQPRLAEGTALVKVAQLFVQTGYENRSLPVLRGERLVGLVTRLDVIRAVMNYFAGVKGKGAETLYISALKEIDEKPDL